MVKSNWSVELSTREVDRSSPMSRAAFKSAPRQSAAGNTSVASKKAEGKITEYRINGYNLGKTAYEYAHLSIANLNRPASRPSPRPPPETGPARQGD